MCIIPMTIVVIAVSIFLYVAGTTIIKMFAEDKSMISHSDYDMQRMTRREFIAKSGINLSKKDDI